MIREAVSACHDDGCATRRMDISNFLGTACQRITMSTADVAARLGPRLCPQHQRVDSQLTREVVHGAFNRSAGHVWRKENRVENTQASTLEQTHGRPFRKRTAFCVLCELECGKHRELRCSDHL